MTTAKAFMVTLFLAVMLPGDEPSLPNQRTGMSAGKKWIVTTSEDSPLNEVVSSLRGNGFTVDEVLTEIGCVTGSASEEDVEKLRKLPGVIDVSPDEIIDIGPPDSSLTW